MIRNPVLFGSGGGTVTVKFKYNTGSSNVSGTIYYLKNGDLQTVACSSALVSASTKTMEADSKGLLLVQFSGTIRNYSVTQGGTILKETINNSGSTVIIQAD